MIFLVMIIDKISIHLLVVDTTLDHHTIISNKVIILKEDIHLLIWEVLMNSEIEEMKDLLAEDINLLLLIAMEVQGEIHLQAMEGKMTAMVDMIKLEETDLLVIMEEIEWKEIISNKELITKIKETIIMIIGNLFFIKHFKGLRSTSFILNSC